MNRHLLVLHFGAQCPWHLWVIEQARKASRELRAEVVVQDVADRPESAEKYRMFFPFMTVIDGRIRVPSPVDAKMLVSIASESDEVNPTSPMPYAQRIGYPAIHPLTEENVGETIPLCIAQVRPIGSREKVRWAKKMLERSGCSMLGFIGFEGTTPKSAVEYLPSDLVPYPLPRKSGSIAFITCIYPTEPDVDYRSSLLQELQWHLRQEDYEEVHVIAGSRTPFPNGPVAFFQEHGFVERQQVDSVDLLEGNEELILMSKKL